jgi:hypothetical protein
MSSGATLRLAASLYTPVECHNRVSQVQKLCDSRNLGGVLLIAGLDGAENEGSTRAINYLFSGISGQDLQIPMLYDNNFEELVVLVIVFYHV